MYATPLLQMEVGTLFSKETFVNLEIIIYTTFKAKYVSVTISQIYKFFWRCYDSHLGDQEVAYCCNSNLVKHCL